MTQGTKRLLLLLATFSLALATVNVPAQAVRVVQNPPPVDVVESLTVPIEGTTSNPESAAISHLAQQAPQWKIDSKQFILESAIPIANGLTVVRFTQHFDDSIVLGALLAMSIDDQGALVGFTIKSGARPNGIRENPQQSAIETAKKKYSELFPTRTVYYFTPVQSEQKLLLSAVQMKFLINLLTVVKVTLLLLCAICSCWTRPIL